MRIETVSTTKNHVGAEDVYKHRSGATGTERAFAGFVARRPLQRPAPLVTCLSALTWTHAM